MTPLPHVIRDESLARIGLVGHFLAISPQLLYGGKSMLTLVSLMLHDWWAACAENEMIRTPGMRRICVLEFPQHRQADWWAELIEEEVILPAVAPTPRVGT